MTTDRALRSPCKRLSSEEITLSYCPRIKRMNDPLMPGSNMAEMATTPYKNMCAGDPGMFIGTSVTTPQPKATPTTALRI
jgi:hypothetical protein